MFNKTKFLPDKYAVSARIVPVVLSLLPWLVYFFVKVSLDVSNWWFGPILAISLVIAAEHIGRTFGKKQEAKLFEVWGGMPSVAMLRHRDKRIDSMTKLRYHKFLQESVPNLSVPTPEEEAKQPEFADQGYSAACSWLREQTRDKEKFHLLTEENINYGFRRNIFGLKPFTITLDLLLVALHICLLVLMSIELQWMETVPTSLFESMGISFIALMHLLIVVFIINPGWVRTQAETYAKRLLSSCDELQK
ncbi:MAG: hypothetical protein OXO49_02000 [Gammaproteobacteria bacterium]|nr:hypothetical protein [Gammaproteobacteria bacterium]